MEQRTPCVRDATSQHEKELRERENHKLKKKEKKKKSDRSDCPLSVDWHSKVPAEPTAQMRTVLSPPEASLVPSMFQETDSTLLE